MALLSPWLSLAAVVAACSSAPSAPEVPPHADPAMQTPEEREWQQLPLEEAVKRHRLHPSFSIPDFTAEVVRVQGREVILRITANPDRRFMRTGYKFAIYDGRAYKGEARVQEVLPDFTVRCQLVIRKGDVVAGDRASTQTN